MKKSVLIGIIVAAVVIVGIVVGVVLSAPDNNDGITTTTTTTTTTGTPTCKHDDPTQIVIVEAVAPTCQETGLTEGMMCNLCGTMVVPQATVTTIECTEGSEWIVDIEATKTESGTHHTECTMCGKKMSEESIPATGSIGLKYSQNGRTYEVSGIGTCTDTEIVIPSEYNGLPVTSIGEWAFSDCALLTSITIPDSVTSIGIRAFQDCTSLTDVYYTGDVAGWFSINFASLLSNPTWYGSNLYFDGELVTNLIIPDSVTSIGVVSFHGCASLTSIAIPDSVTSIDYGAFRSCTSLTSIEVDENNEYYKSIDGNLYSKDEKMLILYAIGKKDKSFTIPATVTSIDSQTFYKCASLTSVTIPDSVMSIGDQAFYKCTSLESITISNSVTEIASEAFRYCTSLKSIKYDGTIEQWNAITKDPYWDRNTDSYTIYCTDGQIAKDGTVTYK